MPILSISEKNTLLDCTDIVSLSLHAAYSATGDNELVGGSPAYARQTVSFNPAANGQKAMVSPPTFDVPADATIQFVGMWDGGGGFQGMEPLGGDGLRPFTSVDSDGTLACPAHGFTIGDSLVPWSGSSAALPPWLTEGTVYYVVSATVDTIQVSDSAGGSVLSSAATGSGFLQRCLPQTFTAQGTFPITSFVLDARAAA